MLKEATSEIITISPEAAQAVQNLITDKEMDGHALRVYVAGNSCSGVQFGMALDNNIGDTDTTIEENGVKIVVDNQSINYLSGASINFIDDPEKGTGFMINAPASTANCGGGCSCGD